MIQLFIYVFFVADFFLSLFFILRKFFTKRKDVIFKKKWRKLNSHNFTKLKSNRMDIDISHILVGKKTYGDLNVYNASKNDVYLKIGSYCSIAEGVLFLLAGEHKIDSISTYPFKSMLWRKGMEAFAKGNIIVNDDVWIGRNALICSGVKIGQGAVIGAGAVVTKNVPPYAIVGGNPAKIIRYRFDEVLIKNLLSIDIVKLLDSFKAKDEEIVYKKLDEALLKQYSRK